MPADQDPKRSPEEKNGATRTLLGEALGKALQRSDGEQFSLFDPGDRMPDDDQVGDQGEARGAGRPPGSRNKATEELRAWARSRFGDPGLKLMERIFADPKALATSLGAPTAWDVWKQQGDWMVRLLPFFWSAMPAELKVEATRHLAIGLSVAPVPAGDRELAGDPLAVLLEFQRLSSAAGEQSYAEQSQEPPTIDATSKG